MPSDPGRQLLRHTLATLAYRIVSFWLPLALGPVAWFAFQRHYHQRVDLEELPEVPAHTG